MIKNSTHKNYVPGYGRNFQKIINEIIEKNENQIYKIFQNKFALDAQKDWNRWRKKLEEWWNNCAHLCENLYLIFWLTYNENKDYSNLINNVNNICNMDYNSIWEFFEKLKEYYEKKWNEKAIQNINWIIKNIKQMRRISEKHTTISQK